MKGFASGSKAPSILRIIAFLSTLALGGIFQLGAEASACSCNWGGPFQKVAPQAELVIRGKVLNYHGLDRGVPLAMDVEILEVLKGQAGNRRVRVWGDNGWLCRPYVSQFPAGTEWILALNGPGSKPGQNPGDCALSICGQFWLQVVEGNAFGNFDDDRDWKSGQKRSLDEVRRVFQGQDPSRYSLKFTGELSAGNAFEKFFGSGFCFRLEPNPHGWTIVIRDPRATEDISRLTPPFHFIPHPRDIEGWHFRNQDNTGPNEAGEKNVNAPGLVREFIFSPAVGKTIAGPEAKTSPTAEEIEQVKRFGRGKLTILDYRLTDLNPGKKAAFEWLRFEAELSWPASTPP
jgi:hypothetical protein